MIIYFLLQIKSETGKKLKCGSEQRGIAQVYVVNWSSVEEGKPQQFAILEYLKYCGCFTRVLNYTTSLHKIIRLISIGKALTKRGQGMKKKHQDLFSGSTN